MSIYFLIQLILPYTYGYLNLTFTLSKWTDCNKQLLPIENTFTIGYYRTREVTICNPYQNCTTITVHHNTQSIFQLQENCPSTSAKNTPILALLWIVFLTLIIVSGCYKVCCKHSET